jgi:formate-dependent nitrite reductase membrane component NrfD
MAVTMGRQKSWEWKVVADVFLGGTGSGAYVAGFLLEKAWGNTPLTDAVSLLGPMLVALGMLVLLLEVGRPLNAFRAFLNARTSWMARGVVFQPLFVGLGIIYGVAGILVEGFKTSGLGIALGSLAAALALIVAAYHGLLYSRAKAIPLWSNPQIPVLFFVSAMAGGASAGLVLAAFFATSTLQLTGLAVAELALLVLTLISIWALTSASPNAAYRASVSSMANAAFWALVVGIGGVLPIGILLASLMTGNIPPGLMALAGVCVLAGTYYLRHAVTAAGQYYSLQVAF